MVHCISHLSSSSPSVLALLRHLVHNIWFRSHHVPRLFALFPLAAVSEAVAGGGLGGVEVPSFAVGPGNDRLIQLVHSSVAPSTWSSHGGLTLPRCFLSTRRCRGWRKELVSRDCRWPVSYVLLAWLLEATTEQCLSHYESLLFHAPLYWRFASWRVSCPVVVWVLMMSY